MFQGRSVPNGPLQAHKLWLCNVNIPNQIVALGCITPRSRSLSMGIARLPTRTKGYLRVN